MAFHDTIGLSDSAKAVADIKCNKQEIYILKVFYQHDPHNNGLTTDELYSIVRERKMRRFRDDLEVMYSQHLAYSDVFKFIDDHYTKMTHALISIRRSVTDLAEAGILVKTEQKRKGTSGIMNCVYKRKG